MSRILPHLAIALICASTLALAKSPAQCYVIGDTSGSKLGHPIGSKQNPYYSLSDVQADAECVVITVLYSDVALDGALC